MYKKTLALIALGSFSMLSADYYQGQSGYGQRSTPSTNQGYYQKDAYVDDEIDQGQYYQIQHNNTRNSRYQQPTNQQYQQRNHVDSARTQKMASDEEIAKEVHGILDGGWFTSGYPNVFFDVEQGTVNLRGSVDSQKDKSKIEERVKRINGVRQVNNRITVIEAKAVDYYKGSPTAINSSENSRIKNHERAYPQDSAATENDKLLNARIREKLNGWFSKGYDTVILTTSNGIVTITGYVDSIEDLQKIKREAKKVDGVRSINSQITVRRQ